MQDRVEITESQILEALRAAIEGPGGDGHAGITTAELVELTGHRDRIVRAGLRKLIDAGVVEPCKVPRKSIAGIWSPQPGYRWIGQMPAAEYEAETPVGGAG